jgi:DNA-binding PadR family transcriptional regulator
MRELTTTSYAILALLAVRSWTTYELAKQMQRSLRDVWPRAESVVYEEPKNLVAHGLASAKTTRTGRRASTVYAITAKGRRQLRRWLEEPGSAPVTEFEALLKVAFADQGTREGLLANLTAVRDYAERRRADVVARLDEYATTGGPFPDRLPVISLVARFQLDQAEMLFRWAEWARLEVESWSG